MARTSTKAPVPAATSSRPAHWPGWTWPTACFASAVPRGTASSWPPPDRSTPDRPPVGSRRPASFQQTADRRSPCRSSRNVPCPSLKALRLPRSASTPRGTAPIRPVPPIRRCCHVRTRPTGTARGSPQTHRGRRPRPCRSLTRRCPRLIPTPRVTRPESPPLRGTPMHANIVVLPGDGIGPEIVSATLPVLEAVAARHGHSFSFQEHDIGGIAIDRHGEPLPASTLEAARKADAILLGAVGGPKWSDPNAKVRPEQGLLAIRKGLGLFANLRPVRPHAAALGASPIKSELLEGVDIVVVRELTGGIYFGDKTRSATDA